jgi:hypothetical protein
MDRQIFLAALVGETNSETMGVGFVRYAKKGERQRRGRGHAQRPFRAHRAPDSASTKNVVADELTWFAIEVVSKNRYQPVPETATSATSRPSQDDWRTRWGGRGG